MVLGEWIGQVLGAALGAAHVREPMVQPMTRRTCLLIVSSVGVKGGCLDGLVVVCGS